MPMPRPVGKYIHFVKFLWKSKPSALFPGKYVEKKSLRIKRLSESQNPLYIIPPKKAKPKMISISTNIPTLMATRINAVSKYRP